MERGYGEFLITRHVARRQKQEPPPRQPRRKIRMMVIPEPEPHTRSVIMYVGPGTVAMKGPGNVTMVCGNCGSPLIVGLKVSALESVVLRCNNCGAFNDSIV
jgi:predicted RNA-binding Zn-ribbon protein involved in translation (DUF1610 family)